MYYTLERIVFFVQVDSRFTISPFPNSVCTHQRHLGRKKIFGSNNKARVRSRISSMPGFHQCNYCLARAVACQELEWLSPIHLPLILSSSQLWPHVMTPWQQHHQNPLSYSIAYAEFFFSSPQQSLFPALPYLSFHFPFHHLQSFLCPRLYFFTAAPANRLAPFLLSALPLSDCFFPSCCYSAKNPVISRTLCSSF